MRVLAITPELPTAGSPGSMAPAARQLQSLRDRGVELLVQDMKGIPKLKYVQALPRLHRRLNDVDLIHAHFGYCGWLARMQLRKPIVVSFMGDDLLGTPDGGGGLEWFSRFMVRANRRLARAVDAVIVKSDEMARVLAPLKCHVIPNGVDLRLFCPLDRGAARQQLGWPDHGTFVLFPGNPDNPRKGFDIASRAQRVAEATLKRELTLVRLWEVSPDRVPLYMNACDAMWMTSSLEGSPNVVKEALACNLPVVSVDVGDVGELLRDVRGCYLCNRDVGELGQRMAESLAGHHRSSGRDALRRKHLDLESVASRVETVYRLALNWSTGDAAAERDDVPAAVSPWVRVSQQHESSGRTPVARRVPGTTESQFRNES